MYFILFIYYLFQSTVVVKAVKQSEPLRTFASVGSVRQLLSSGR